MNDALTPETNAVHLKQGLTHAEYRRHAQRLERERDSLTDQRDFAQNLIRILERERDEAREALKTGGMLDIIDRAGHERAAAIRERDDAREQRAKAVEKYQASIKEMHEVGMQRDRLAAALQNLCDSFLGNKSSRDITAQLVEAGKALAALNQPEP